jgi:hypothetical protein
MTGWSTATDPYYREDGCTVASVTGKGRRVEISSSLRPDVVEVLEKFRDESLEKCFDAPTAIDRLTKALGEIGHTDFVVMQKSYVAGPDARWEEIQAHAEAGCIFYTLSGAEEDGTLLYFLNGG